MAYRDELAGGGKSKKTTTSTSRSNRASAGRYQAQADAAARRKTPQGLQATYEARRAAQQRNGSQPDNIPRGGRNMDRMQAESGRYNQQVYGRATDPSNDTQPSRLGAQFMGWATRNANNPQAIAARYGNPSTYDLYTQPADRGTYGIDYGPNWTRSNYNPANDPGIIDPVTGRQAGQGWRQALSGMMMTPDEYQRRAQSWTEQFTPGYSSWWNQAKANAGSMTPDQFNRWKANNQRPAGFLQTAQEYTVRSNAAPTGYGYQPFGSSYYKKGQKATGTGSNQNTGGYGSYSGYGSGYGYGGYGGGGGGGGGGGSDVGSFYNGLLNWRVLEVQGG